ncbi:contractile injection system tape measure protein [Belliella sp. DSM 107340]|uniref:Contractile injection system tape measure protein n=1 Tax=Belliella calami TaxID=2923436 RepID=A0ABS9URB2_9BACT|nr:contractile injection system tape measure protein [Belliella calami]MCH7399177.1 contractile injection system tape measure protein [Belliella calami]
MKEERIIVEKLAIDLQYQSKLTSKQIMKDAELFVYKHVLPLLEKILLNYKFKGNLRINNAELEIDLKSLITNKTVFGFNEAQLETELKRKLDQLILSKIDLKKPIAETSNSFIEILIYFLSNGSLPWFAPRNYNLDTELRLFLKIKNPKTSQKKLISQLKITFQKNPKTFLRFIKQIENELLLQILTFGQETAFSSLESKTILKQTQSKNRVLVWAFVFYKSWFFPLKSTAILNDIIPDFITLEYKEFIRLIKSLSFIGNNAQDNSFSPNSSLLKLTDFVIFQQLFNPRLREKEYFEFFKSENKSRVKEKPKEKIEEKKATEKQATIYIENAGLIIIHPFLLNFYKNIGVLDQKNRIPKENYDLVIHSLHYLSTGKTYAYENSLLFEKFLCGVPIDFAVDRFFELETNIKEEANSLLMAAIGHWGKLKNTSPEGLREMFFIREGKLELESKRLTIKRMSQDILLESLPWNLTIVKFPWLKNSLFVHW